MNATLKAASAPLNEVMLAMDVVDTLRHRQDLVTRELAGTNRKERLVERLRAIYKEQGIDVPDHILLEGVAALEEDRFIYMPTPPSISRTLAQIYTSRGKWGKWFAGIGGILALAIGAYFLAYLPYQANQREAARIELAEEMPAQMQALYQSIFDETKVQAPVAEARVLLSRGQTAASEGDREQSVAIIEDLSQIRDELRAVYAIKVVNREGVRSGFWTFPEINRDATNYYIVVEALTKDGDILSLDIANEESGKSENVNMWGLRVPQSVYNSIGADKRDDGIIQRNLVGQKEFGYPEPNYLIPVSGGAVTRW